MYDFRVITKVTQCRSGKNFAENYLFETFEHIIQKR